MCLVVLVTMILTTLTNLTKDRHSVNHTACLKEITLFGKISMIEFSLSSQYNQSTEKHNESVK
jgi:hypothetical protein